MVENVPQSWYALTVKPQHEKAVAKALEYKRLEQLLPVYKTRRRWSDRVKLIDTPLFPGYVFCRFPQHERLSVLTTPGVRSIVGFGRQITPVSGDEVEAIRSMAASGLPLQPWPFLEKGQRVVITHGPLEGLEGNLARTPDDWQGGVSVELLQRSVAVSLDRGSIRLVDQPVSMTAPIQSAAASGGGCRAYI
ncbi:MAG: NusG-like protein [bacterium]|nr:NusG-like protein [bacterium]